MIRSRELNNLKDAENFFEAHRLLKFTEISSLKLIDEHGVEIHNTDELLTTITSYY